MTPDTLDCLSLESPVGQLQLVADETALLAVRWPVELTPGWMLRTANIRKSPDLAQCASPILRDSAAQLQQYFSAERQQFELPLRLIGSDFQIRVWHMLQQVPYGQSRSYGQIAQAIGQPSAVRAVASAIGRNPLSIIIPCHRILGQTGRLTGFAGGLAAKSTLLQLEGIPYLP